MRICLLSDAQSPHTQRWCRYFAERGHETAVVSFRPAEIPGVTVYPLAGGEQLGKGRYLTHIPKIRGLIRSIQPDILHAHHATSYGLVGALSSWRPFLIHTWGRDVLDFPDNPFYRRMVQFNLGRADAITCTSQAMVQAVKRLAGNSLLIRHIPFGVDLELFCPYPERDRDPDTVVIGSTKSFEPVYGLENLLQAFAILHATRPNIQLLLVGDGTQRASLGELATSLGIKEAVTFLGRVEHDQIPAYLGQMDIFVAPSLLESFGVSIVEASAMELPVVATRVGGIPEVVLDGVSGFLGPAGEVPVLTAQLGKLADDGELRRRMGQAGRRLVEHQYDWYKNAAAMEKLYREILAQGRSSRS